ncbi:hypothetical protein Mgra_00002869 [Meloidogyne graminicola]|uniref:Phosphatidylethanolamine-binding protein n=1 Tax=Meloidogyne graminicola TaxID=189291 RepID=A0A8S9ZXD8_9BILA|nr:hypothetical protein Mgra_00002869 [Meloidogyne graminicola]
MASIASAFSTAEIVPQILPEAPKQKLNVMFNGVQVEPGNELPIHHLKNAPRVTLNVDPESTFSIVMIDPDNLSRKNPSVAEWLHWLVVNIPASNILEGINGGQHQQPYGKKIKLNNLNIFFLCSPAPQPRTGEHRYIIVLFEHQGRRLQVPKYNTRAKFSLKKFIEKHKLEGCLLAANYFIAKNQQQ